MQEAHGAVEAFLGLLFREAEARADFLVREPLDRAEGDDLAALIRQAVDGVRKAWGGLVRPRGMTTGTPKLPGFLGVKWLWVGGEVEAHEEP